MYLTINLNFNLLSFYPCSINHSHSVRSHSVPLHSYTHLKVTAELIIPLLVKMKILLETVAVEDVHIFKQIVKCYI